MLVWFLKKYPATDMHMHTEVQCTMAINLVSVYFEFSHFVKKFDQNLFGNYIHVYFKVTSRHD